MQALKAALVLPLRLDGCLTPSCKATDTVWSNRIAHPGTTSIMKIFIAIFFLLPALAAAASPALPTCDKNLSWTEWTKYTGTFKLGTSIFTGEFRDGDFHKGTIVFEDGAKDFGNFKNYGLHGTGTRTFAYSGTKLIGQFSDNAPSGKGRMVTKAGVLLVEGLWSTGPQGVLVEVLGTDWLYISEASDGSEAYFIQPQSIKRLDSNRRAWSSSTRAAPDEQGKRSYKTLYEFDCTNARTRILALMAYSGTFGSGSTLSNENGLGDWQDAAPGTVAEHLLTGACKHPLL